MVQSTDHSGFELEQVAVFIQAETPLPDMSTTIKTTDRKALQPLQSNV
ncbi:hypothetical protein [Lentibacillus daqui]|nr:hypothetical protein [Lentibacillus daqui]